ncbi:MAG: DUF3376 domain-containing protein [Rhodothermales bacterium]|nr:DUF3376 domain-containing protein [Rhodothermales bacterium]
MPKTRKIALILAGGVSLGAYQAGVITEILHALDVINRRRNDSGDSPIVLDVITGASAGSMTAALIARIMLCDFEARRGHLRDAWVEDIDILRLLVNIPGNALLSKDVIWEIANRYILRDEDLPRDNRASFAPEKLRLSFTLSNMHGIDYAIPNLSRDDGTSFASTFFSDVGRFEVSDANLDDSLYWKTIVEAAMASGNFPIVFQPQPVTRFAADYKGSVQEEEGFFGDSGRALSFLDGGMFNNEPLREAVHLASSVDGGPIDPTRLFILVDPNVNQSRHAAEVLPDDPLEKIVGRMADMVRGESTARDWLRTTQINVELSWRDQLLQEIAEIFTLESIQDSNAIAEKLKTVAENIHERRRSVFASSAQIALVDEIEMLRTRYETVYPDLTQPVSESNRSAMFLYFTFILNSVSDLGHKSRLNLSIIGADKTKTAGDQLNSFGGFFDQKWREHDFRVGRIETSRHLAVILGESYEKELNDSGEAVASYTIPDEWANFPDVSIQHADDGLRKNFRNVVLDRSTEVMRRLSIPGLIRFMLRLYLKRKLSNILKLR